MANGKTTNGRPVGSFFDRPESAAPPPTHPVTWTSALSTAAQIGNSALLVTCMMVAGVVVVPGLFQLSAKVAQLERDVDSKSQAATDRELLLEASRKQTMIQQGHAAAAAETANRLAAENIRLANELSKTLKRMKDE